MKHSHRLACFCGEESAVNGYVAYVAAGNVEPCQLGGIEILGWRVVGKNSSPDLRALERVGKREVNYEAQATQKRRVECALHIRRQNCEATIVFHSLQQVADLN